MDTATLRKLVRELKDGQTLILSPDVYDALAASAGYGPEVMGVAGSHSVRIQRSVAMKPGTAIVMAEAHFDAPHNWAGSFLSKSGPGIPSTIDMGLVTPPEAMMAPEPEPVESPPPFVSRSRERQRIVDT